MGLGFRVLLLSIFCSIAWGDSYGYDSSYGYDYYASAGNSSYAIGKNSENPLTIQELYKSIDALAEPSIENLLPVLKQKDPSLFRSYILMYGSRSLQGSSFLNPRALLVAKNAELIVSFNGQAKQKGYNELEVMFFDRQKNTFSFQEISFSGGKVSYSEVNPRKCLACHQSPTRATVDPRPNWESYNLWPGAYNSVGHISPVTDPHYTPTNVTMPDGTIAEKLPAGSRYIPFLGEQRALEEEKARAFFTEVQPVHPRYKNLVPMKDFGSKQFPQYFTTIPINQDYANDMPTRLTQSLAVLNARRLGRMIQTDYPQIYERYKYALLAAAKCYVVALPPATQAWHSERLQDPALKALPQRERLVRLELAVDFIFKAYGVDTSDWTMDFNTNGSFAVTDKYGIPGGTLSNNIAVAGGLQDVWQVPEFTADKNCEALIAKSLQTLSSPAPTEAHFSELELSDTTPLINRCINCHVTTMVAPYIPFDDPIALQKELVKSSGELYKKIQYRLGLFPKFGDAMPPQGYVPQKKKQEVLDYINSLYASGSTKL